MKKVVRIDSSCKSRDVLSVGESSQLSGLVADAAHVQRSTFEMSQLESASFGLQVASHSATQPAQPLAAVTIETSANSAQVNSHQPTSPESSSLRRGARGCGARVEMLLVGVLCGMATRGGLHTASRVS